MPYTTNVSELPLKADVDVVKILCTVGQEMMSNQDAVIFVNWSIENCDKIC